MNDPETRQVAQSEEGFERDTLNRAIAGHVYTLPESKGRERFGKRESEDVQCGLAENRPRTSSDFVGMPASNKYTVVPCAAPSPDRAQDDVGFLRK
jgi:hypothetical protein